MPKRLVKKEYKSVMERINELHEIHNSDVPDSIRLFWSAIISYSDVCNELGSEGNSGEFHSEKEQERIEKELVKSEEELKRIFSENTGFLPISLNLNEHIYVNGCGMDLNGFWKFKKI